MVVFALVPLEPANCTKVPPKTHPVECGRVAKTVGHEQFHAKFRMETVKEEVDEDVLEVDDHVEAQDLLGEPTFVPGTVLLDKLSALLHTGRGKLRYVSEGGWGVNGILFERWSSFRANSDGCRFVDEADWRTGAEDWTEEERQQLADLRSQAELLPSSSLPQPSALRPRSCRRALFRFHRERFREKRVKKVAPKAGAPGSGSVKGTPKAAPKAAPKVDFAGFLKLVKEQLAATGHMGKYKALVSAASEGASCARLAEILEGFPDLVAEIPTANPAAAKEPPSAKTKRCKFYEQGRCKKGAACTFSHIEIDSKAVAKAARPAPTPKTAAAVPAQAPAVSIVGDPVAALTRLALPKARPSQRLRLLRYLRVLRPGERQVFLLQRSKDEHLSWVLDEVVGQLQLENYDTLAVRSAHVCAVRDFFTHFGEEEIYEFKAAELPLARASNEARLQLALKAKVAPLFVDDPGLEMEESGYAKRARTAGYQVSVLQV